MLDVCEAREGLQWKARSEATSEDLQRKARPERWSFESLRMTSAGEGHAQIAIISEIFSCSLLKSMEMNFHLPTSNKKYISLFYDFTRRKFNQRIRTEKGGERRVIGSSARRNRRTFGTKWCGENNVVLYDCWIGEADFRERFP